MRKIVLGVLLVILAMAARGATRQDIELSAIVNGTIVLARDGTVQSALIDDPAQYGQAIADFVHNTAMHWRFQPVLQDGQPVMAKASMHARVVLKQKPNGNFDARIKGVTFGNNDPNDTRTLHASADNTKTLPIYPGAAIHARVQGAVYLALRVDRSGHVIDAIAQQVNLDNIGPDNVLKEYRKILADAALKAARHWTYTIPSTGKLAKRDNWTVHVPVIFKLEGRGVAKFNRVWKTYVPGPYTPAPWVDKPNLSAADAIADGGLQTDGAGPVLLSAASIHG